MSQCEFDGCLRKSKYAIYRLHEDGTKTWGHYCDQHERKVDLENIQLQQENPQGVWHDPLLQKEEEVKK